MLSCNLPDSESLFSVPVDIAITLIVNHVKFFGVIFFIVCLNLYCFRYLFSIIDSAVAQKLVSELKLNPRKSFLRETMVGNSSIRIGKFNGKNSFGLWQIKMKVLLKQL